MKEIEVQKEQTMSGESARGRWEPVICPRADVREVGDHFEVEIELPGIPASGVTLEVEDDELRISGTRSNPEGDSRDVYLMRERRAGTYSRVFRLGAAVDRQGIEGKMTDGVLRIRIPKQKSALPRRIQVS